MQAETRRLRSQIGVAKRLRPEDTKALENLRREFGAARLEEYIQKTLETFPPLSQSQRDRLAGLLLSGRQDSSAEGAAA
ncbi:hypothetical protein [Geodermatophilus sp. SYSU D01036]